MGEGWIMLELEPAWHLSLLFWISCLTFICLALLTWITYLGYKLRKEKQDHEKTRSDYHKELIDTAFKLKNAEQEFKQLAANRYVKTLKETENKNPPNSAEFLNKRTVNLGDIVQSSKVNQSNVSKSVEESVHTPRSHESWMPPKSNDASLVSSLLNSDSPTSYDSPAADPSPSFGGGDSGGGGASSEW
jgi:uncharacterized membrane protein YgcG